MSSYFPQHPSPSPSRIRQEGFQIPTDSPSLNAPPSPTTPFDTQGAFFAGSHNVFPNAFRKFGDRNGIDFSDTLASMMGMDSADDLHNSSSRQPPDFVSSSNGSHAISQPTGGHYFDISSFPSHLNNFRASADNGLAANGLPDPSSPAGLGLAQSQPAGPPALGHNFLGDPPLTYATSLHHTPTLAHQQQQQHQQHAQPPMPRHRASFSGTSVGPPPVLPRLNTMRTASPSTLSSPLVSEMGGSPFPPTGAGPVTVAGNVGVQPSSGAVRSTSRSRSRSRPATARDPSVNGRAPRVTKKRTQSISSPSPPGGIGAGAITIPSNAQAGSQPMSIIIPDPRATQLAHSAAGAASPATTAASWVFSPSSAQTAFSYPGNDNSTAATSFSNTFAASGSQMGGVAMDDDKTPPSKEDKQQALLNEKRRRRRESHNAVERRRRDNINEKISELATLIPDCLLFDENAAGGSGQGNGSAHEGSPSASGEASEEVKPSTLNGLPSVIDVENGLALLPDDDPTALMSGSGTISAAAANAMKANKGVILRKSVDYIRYLQQLVQAQAEKNRDLETQLSQYRGPLPPSSLHHHSNSSSSPESNPGSSSMSFGDFSTFDFARFQQPQQQGGGGGSDGHLVSVKEEEAGMSSFMNGLGVGGGNGAGPNGVVDMGILPDEHVQRAGPGGQEGNGYQYQTARNAGFDLSAMGFAEHHHQQQQQYVPSFHPQSSPAAPFTPPTQAQSHAHFLLQQQQAQAASAMVSSPAHTGISATGSGGSGSGVSDLEDVEEEDESAVHAAAVSSPPTSDMPNGNSQRGRKEVRDGLNGGRFTGTPTSRNASVSVGRGGAARGKSVSRSRAKTIVKREDGDDMSVDGDA